MFTNVSTVRQTSANVFSFREPTVLKNEILATVRLVCANISSCLDSNFLAVSTNTVAAHRTSWLASHANPCLHRAKQENRLDSSRAVNLNFVQNAALGLMRYRSIDLFLIIHKQLLA